MNTLRCTFIGTLALLGTAAYANVRAADQIIIAKGRCQMTVPADWTADSLLKTDVSAPDGSASAVLSSPHFTATLAQVKAMVQQTLVPKKVFEDSAQRLWYQYRTKSQPGSGWYVGVPGKGGTICAAQISFKSAAQAAFARKIALSVKPTP